MKVTVMEGGREIPDWRMLPPDVDWFVHEAKRFTYKPGVELVITFNAFAVTVIVVAHVKDSRDWREIVNLPRRDVEVVAPYSLSRMVLTDSEYDERRPQIIPDVIKTAIRNHELHEIDEWLRYDGKHVKDPHPKVSVSA